MESGTQLGAYRVLQQIGEGGMGSVWMAEHAMLGRRAAIKVLHSEYSHDNAVVTRFFNEARAATAISDLGIVQIFDFGRHTDGSAYIVMELLEGETLAQRLERTGRLGPHDALRLMRQIATSLGAAHRAGIIHRDLKPENVFVIRDAEVAGGERTKIVDFGIAKLGGNSGVKTQTQAVMGTPAYMSPEQCRGAGQVDQRSDVYALGCLLYALLTGNPPFTGEGVGELIVKHMRDQPVPPSMVVPGITREVDQLVLCCLAKDPAQRFASGADLASAIGLLLGSQPSLPMVATAPGQTSYRAAATPTTLSAAAGSPTGVNSGRSRTPLFAAGGLVVAGAIVAIVMVSQSGGKDSEPAAKPEVAAAPAPAPAPAAKTEPAPPPAPKPTPEDIAGTQIKDVLAKFAAWAPTHDGAPCPDVAALGGADNDPWGHAIVITCTDQPASQRVGAISLGPDGKLGTADDIASWQLGRDVVALVHGPRWVTKAPPAAPPPVVKTTTVHATVKKQTVSKPAVDDDGIPTSR